MVKVVKAKNANCWVSARMRTRERKRILQVLNTLPHPHNPPPKAPCHEGKQK